MISRGDIWLVLGASAGGSENRVPYPCVILSPPETHDYLGLVTVAPIGPAGNRAAYRVPLTVDDQPAVIRLEQIRTVEKRALMRQTGTVERKTLSAALAALREMFAE